MTYDPGRLAYKLESLSQEFSGWSYAALDIMHDAESAQQHGKEQLSQATQHAQLASNQLAEDQEALENMLQSLKHAHEVGTDLLGQAQKLLSQAAQAVSEAHNTLQYWKEELIKAKEWLEQALRRLAAAKMELEMAQYALSAANRSLSNAEYALRSCRNDDSRHSCSNEEAQVRAAAARVDEAKKGVYLAEREVRAAEEEVAQARARVAVCTTAVSFAGQAVEAAEKAQHTAHQCVSAIERSMEYAKAVDKATQEAQVLLTREETAVQAIQASVRSASENVEQARRELLQGGHYQESALNAAHGARNMLDERAEHLRRQEQPDLYTYKDRVIDAVKMGLVTAAALTVPWLNNPMPSNVLQHSSPQPVVQAQRDVQAMKIVKDNADQMQENVHDVYEALEKRDKLNDHLKPSSEGHSPPLP
jgi:hypothetical protein